MKNTWLNYSKEILLKVSFDRKLLLKELKKSLLQLSMPDKKVLYHWAKTNFGVTFSELKGIHLGEIYGFAI